MVGIFSASVFVGSAVIPMKSSRPMITAMTAKRAKQPFVFREPSSGAATRPDQRPVPIRKSGFIRIRERGLLDIPADRIAEPIEKGPSTNSISGALRCFPNYLSTIDEEYFPAWFSGDYALRRISRGGPGVPPSPPGRHFSISQSRA
jgi:hypothetical protein